MVTASGFKDNLAVVTHASDCLSSNDQVGSLFSRYLLLRDRSSVVLFRIVIFFITNSPKLLSCTVTIIFTLMLS